MGIVSYAQNCEDVMLWRALGDVEAGFWIDVGAADPSDFSVTRAFSERGWHGINIEPSPAAYALLQAARPADLNLPLALAATPGMMRFYDCEDSTLSSLDPGIAEANRHDGRAVTTREIKVTTLAEVCRVHAPEVVHFLKIDVEGAEALVLAGADFTACRPWILVIEATVPLSQIAAHRDWEPGLLAAGYRFAWFDGLNRFYVAEERWDRLGPAFAAPPNVFDGFQLFDPAAAPAAARLLAAEAARTAAEAGLAAARSELAENLARHAEEQTRLRDALGAELNAVEAARAVAQTRLAMLEAERAAAPIPRHRLLRLPYQLRWFLGTDQRAETAGLRSELARLAAAVETLRRQLRP